MKKLEPEPTLEFAALVQSGAVDVKTMAGLALAGWTVAQRG